MRQLATGLLLIELAILACSCSPGSAAADRQAVRDCLDAYKTALVNADGKSAVKVVTTETKEHYARILSLALNGSESEVKALGMGEKMLVLSARQAIEPGALQQMTGESLLIYCVNQGWNAKQGVQDLSIGTVRLYGDRAVGEVLDLGKPTPLTYLFLRQQGQWRFDVISNLARNSGEMQSFAWQQTLSEDEYILRSLESFTGKKVDESVIWKPINQKTGAVAAASHL